MYINMCIYIYIYIHINVLLIQVVFVLFSWTQMSGTLFFKTGHQPPDEPRYCGVGEATMKSDRRIVEDIIDIYKNQE